MKDTLFINQEIVSTGVFKIIKDASVILSHDESRFIVDRMIDTLNMRNTSKALFLELRENTDDEMETLLSSIFKIPNGHIYNKKSIIDYKVLSKDRILDSKNNYKGFEPFKYENYENYYNIFEAINNEDILLHHPYDSYDTVVKFIQHSAMDPNVEVIRQTLYRVSSINSPIVNALCDAARNGKSVVVLVEIKARFDEDNNIKVIEKLQRNGVKVVLGEEYLKTADLTQYEKINPNSRTISVDSKNFSLPVETPQTNAAASDATTNVPLTYEVAGQFSKKAVVSEKALPNTGSEQSIFLLLMGMVAGLAGILSSRKPKQK